MQTLREKLKELNYETEVEVRNSTKFAKEHFGAKPVIAIEIGVKTGGHAETICSNLNVEKMYLIDPWIPYKQLYNGKELKYYAPPMAYELTKERFADFKNITIMKGFSINVVRSIADNSIDYIYVDGDHDYEAVKEDIKVWHSKLKKGGIMAGHDYGDKWIGVKKAVDEWEEKNKLDFTISKDEWWYIK